jgi:hypothetical protein
MGSRNIVPLLVAKSVAQVLPVFWNLGAENPFVDQDQNTLIPDDSFMGDPVGTCPGPFDWTDLASLIYR